MRACKLIVVLMKYVSDNYVFCWQRRRKIDNWGGGGGADIHIFVLPDCKNNQFQKKLMLHHPPPPILLSSAAPVSATDISVNFLRLP